VKNLLITLISSLLLSSPVIGDNHEGETLYQWGVDCVDVDEYVRGRCDNIWMGFGDKETHPKYNGQVKDGKPNGLGILNQHIGWKYAGSWKNGKKDGLGTYSHHLTKQKYVGEYKDGRFWNGSQYDKKGKISYKYVKGRSNKQ
jgi:hypothetical protein